MRLLNPNIINFGYPVYNPTTGMADATVLFFEQKPDLTKTVTGLNTDAVAVSSISFKAVAQGYVYHAESSVGVKAIEGSEYWPEYGVTVHHPASVLNMVESDETKWAIPSLPAKQINTALLSHPIGAMSPLKHKGRSFYRTETTFDCMIRIQRDNKGALTGTIPAFGEDPAKNVTIPDGQKTETMAAYTTQYLELDATVSNAGRLCFAQQGDHTTTPITKTLAYAVIVFTRYGTGNTPTDNVVFGTEVGKTGSGAYLELFETTLSTGQYPIITNLRTGIL